MAEVAAAAHGSTVKVNAVKIGTIQFQTMRKLRTQEELILSQNVFFLIFDSLLLCDFSYYRVHFILLDIKMLRASRRHLAMCLAST